MPRAGWVEHDPLEIWQRTQEVVQQALAARGLAAADLAGLGITNQRETTVVWNPITGEPYGNAIVWQDTRTDKIAAALDRDGRGDVIRHRAGLPPATYFSGGKLQWILENVDGVREAAERGRAIFGTTDSWLLWNLTGGVDGGQHITDVTNASRTMLMDLETLDWDRELLELLRDPAGDAAEHRAVFPRMRRTSALAQTARSAVRCRSGAISATSKQQWSARSASAKATPRTPTAPATSCCSTPARQLCRSSNGLLSTVCYQFGDASPVYALEGSIAVTGSAVQWLRDQLKIIRDAAEVETLARQVDSAAQLYFVPAFSGLFAPYWRSDARGVIVGLSRFHTREHIARATLEAICYQSRDVVEAMEKDAGVQLDELKVDGGVTANALCMQIQADTLGVEVSKPVVAETTALGAAYAAGLATGFWASPDDLRENWLEDKRWIPQISEDERAAGYDGWKKAVERTLDWVQV